MMDIALLGMSKDQDPRDAEVRQLDGRQLGDYRRRPHRAGYHAGDLIGSTTRSFAMHWSIEDRRPSRRRGGTELEFVSADGRTLRVWRGGWKVLDPGGKELPKEEAEDPPNHWRNWVDCVENSLEAARGPGFRGSDDDRVPPFERGSVCGRDGPLG